MKPKEILKSTFGYLRAFVKWLVLAVIVGVISGVVGVLFEVSVEYATEARTSVPWLIFLLPVGGVVIALLYHYSRVDDNIGTDEVLYAARSKKGVPFFLTPLIFVSTVITHLLGGSAGREGAALQLGGSIASRVSRIFRLGHHETHAMILCGMSGVFSALFGTPITAALFAMEVITIGKMYYFAIIPCFISSLTAYRVAMLCGVEPVRFTIAGAMDLSALNVFHACVLAALCALLSIVFCVLLRAAHQYFPKIVKNAYFRALLGASVIVLLTVILGTGDYNGAGMQVIERAIGGECIPTAFVWKLLFTVITIAAGFKGGEIVPTFFIGATFGCVMGGILGLDPGITAALGLVVMFCGVTNTPIASMILSIELFGSEYFLVFAIACAISYVLSGNFSLYHKQNKIMEKMIYVPKNTTNKTGHPEKIL